MSLQGTKKVGLIGGSFDPVHSGHLMIAQDAADRLELDEVVFIPANIPPHKQDQQRVSAEHRLNMLRLATESNLRFTVSSIEIDRGGVSYTFDTVCELRADQPDAELVLIVGSDTLVDLPNWYNVQELLEIADVATLVRPGDVDLAAIEAKLALDPELRDRLMGQLYDSRLVDISSSEIRARVAEGLGVKYLVPPEVEMYIFEHGLYQN